MTPQFFSVFFFCVRMLVPLLPKSRGEAMHNLANNFPVGTTRKRAITLITPNAVAAWKHHHGQSASRFAWDSHMQHGPKATLCVVSNGPHFFARDWCRLFIAEVVAKSRLFSRLHRDILRIIVDGTYDGDYTHLSRALR